MSKLSVSAIDALLPQTQCGLCTYGACRPYAEALVYKNAPINLCPPGGVATLQQLGAILQQDPSPFIMEMEKNTKLPTRAVIREHECIGCTICIQACPVDAIIGSAKQMHTVIADACTGCDLCLDPCPMDCIDMIPVTAEDPLTTQRKADDARDHYNARLSRLARDKAEHLLKHNRAKLANQTIDDTKLARQQAIRDAVARVIAKRQRSEAI
ncbi:MAG: RnfABCDGE type electron transport complex subunit B [Pseudomonadota bacterium]|nr:RnfABCDGE type electron transport complex subunit B [Pseudomonadota bacterium]